MRVSLGLISIFSGREGRLHRRFGRGMRSKVQFGQSLVRTIVVGIDLQNFFVSRDRVVAPALVLAQRGEVEQRQLGLRIEFERPVVVALGRGIVARRQHRAPGVVVTQERLRIERDQLLENLARLLVIAALGVERPQEQIGLLILGREPDNFLVIRLGAGVVAKRRVDTGREQQGAR